MDLDLNILNTPATAYNIFAPVHATKITNREAARRLFEDNGADFNYSAKELDSLLFYYYALTGYSKDSNLYWFMVDITSATNKDRLDNHFLIYFVEDSLKIDQILLDFFEIFPSERFSAQILKPEGTLESLIMSAASWFGGFEDVYLKECSEVLGKRKLKKTVDKKKKRE